MRKFMHFLMGAVAFTLMLAVLVLICDRTASGFGDVAGEKPADYVQALPDSDVKLTMVGIPGGTFNMGSSDSEPGRLAEEGPVHPVKIAPFWMGKTEVTWDEYDQYWKTTNPAKEDEEFAKVGSQPKLMPSPGRLLPTPTKLSGWGEGFPVISITHHAAMQYCRWLSLKTGKVTGLPTEAEWEYACQAGPRRHTHTGRAGGLEMRLVCQEQRGAAHRWAEKAQCLGPLRCMATSPMVPGQLQGRAYRPFR